MTTGWNRKTVRAYEKAYRECNHDECPNLAQVEYYIAKHKWREDNRHPVSRHRGWQNERD